VFTARLIVVKRCGANRDKRCRTCIRKRRRWQITSSIKKTQIVHSLLPLCYRQCSQKVSIKTKNRERSASRGDSHDIEPCANGEFVVEASRLFRCSRGRKKSRVDSFSPFSIEISIFLVPLAGDRDRDGERVLTRRKIGEESEPAEKRERKER